MRPVNPILLDIPKLIQTPRLILRAPRPGDGKEVNAAILESFDSLSRWMPWARTRPDVAESEERVRRACAEWILRTDMRIHIYEKDSGRMVGSTGLHRMKWEVPAFEIGYWVRSPDAGKGYITESTHALTRFCFEFLKAKRVEIRCNSENQRSVAIAKRLAFELEGCLRNEDTHVEATHCRDTLVFSRLNCEGLPPLEVSW